MRARRAETAERNGTAVPCRFAQPARRTWQQLYRCLVRAQPGPERSGGTRPKPQFDAVAGAVAVEANDLRKKSEEERMQIPIERYTLNNGLRVILSEDHALPVVAVNLWYNVGSRNERPGRTGLAHLFEHMMFQGSQHVPETGHIAHVERVAEA